MILLLSSLSYAAPIFDLSMEYNLEPGSTLWTAASLVNVREAPYPSAAVQKRLVVGTRVKAVDRVGDWVQVEVGGVQGWIYQGLLSPMGQISDLDGDGISERVVVSRDEQGRSFVWLREGEQVQKLFLYPWPDPYLGEWSVIPKEQAGTTLLQVDLYQDSCGSFPTFWLSYENNTLREALSVEPWVDGALGASFEVDFSAPGVASVVTEERDEVGEVVSGKVQSCVLSEGVFACR